MLGALCAISDILGRPLHVLTYLGFKSCKDVTVTNIPILQMEKLRSSGAAVAPELSRNLQWGHTDLVVPGAHGRLCSDRQMPVLLVIHCFGCFLGYTAGWRRQNPNQPGASQPGSSVHPVPPPPSNSASQDKQRVSEGAVNCKTPYK